MQTSSAKKEFVEFLGENWQAIVDLINAKEEVEQDVIATIMDYIHKLVKNNHQDNYQIYYDRNAWRIKLLPHKFSHISLSDVEERYFTFEIYFDEEEDVEDLESIEIALAAYTPHKKEYQETKQIVESYKNKFARIGFNFDKIEDTKDYGSWYIKLIPFSPENMKASKVDDFAKEVIKDLEKLLKVSPELLEALNEKYLKSHKKFS